MLLTGKERLLIADGRLLSLATLIGTLKDDYHVVTAETGAQIFNRLEKYSIDLILLDTAFADGDGYAVCRALKADPKHRDIPVIFITADNRVSAEEQGFQAGASDYIAKPFNAPIVKARVHNQLRLSAAVKELRRLNQLALDANPKTGLPGNNSIMGELQQLVENPSEVCVIYADLDHFKVYNDTYGFAQGDEIIHFTANVIRIALQAAGCSEAFIGHIGGDDFVFVVPAAHCSTVTGEIIRRIDQGVLEFYSDEHAAQGYLLAANREGVEKRHPLISLSMGGIDLTQRRVATVFEIIDVCTETKKAAKQQPGSSVLICQREGRSS